MSYLSPTWSMSVKVGRHQVGNILRSGCGAIDSLLLSGKFKKLLGCPLLYPGVSVRGVHRYGKPNPKAAKAGSWGELTPQRTPIRSPETAKLKVRNPPKPTFLEQAPLIVLANQLAQKVPDAASLPESATEDAASEIKTEEEAMEIIEGSDLSVEEWSAVIGSTGAMHGAAAAMYNAVLLSLVEKSSWSQSLEMLKQMDGGICNPDVVSYSAVVTACYSAGKKRQALKVLKAAEMAALSSAQKDSRTPSKLKRTYQQAKLEVLYEDDDLVAVNKPSGMLIHPGPGTQGDKRTLVNGLVRQFKGSSNNIGGGLSTLNGPNAPGILHRLDRGTSGVILVAKTNLAHALLVHTWKTRNVEKYYLALVEGIMTESSGDIRSPVDGLTAHTSWTVVETFPSPVEGGKGGYSLVRCRIHTGRRHQVRIHLASLGHCLCGDPLYRRLAKEASTSPNCRRPSVRTEDDPIQYLLEGRKPGTAIFLHAHELKLTHPLTQARLELSAPLSAHFRKGVQYLREMKES